MNYRKIYNYQTAYARPGSDFNLFNAVYINV